MLILPSVFNLKELLGNIAKGVFVFVSAKFLPL
jgi:hypothetical protein